jgi:hypothetical protein
MADGKHACRAAFWPNVGMNEGAMFNSIDFSLISSTASVSANSMFAESRGRT